MDISRPTSSRSSSSSKEANQVAELPGGGSSRARVRLGSSLGSAREGPGVLACKLALNVREEVLSLRGAVGQISPSTDGRRISMPCNHLPATDLAKLLESGAKSELVCLSLVEEHREQVLARLQAEDLCDTGNSVETAKGAGVVAPDADNRREEVESVRVNAD